MKQLKDSEKREKYKVYGELINAFGYGLTPDDKFLEAANYYDDNKIIKIPIDSTKTPAENAQKYFDKYGKMKRTAEALNELILETKGQNRPSRINSEFTGYRLKRRRPRPDKG